MIVSPEAYKVFDACIETGLIPFIKVTIVKFV